VAPKRPVLLSGLSTRIFARNIEWKRWNKKSSTGKSCQAKPRDVLKMCIKRTSVEQFPQHHYPHR